MHFFTAELSILFWILFALLVIGLPVAALISLLTRKFHDNILRLVWAIVIIGFPFFGPILYFILGKRSATA